MTEGLCHCSDVTSPLIWLYGSLISFQINMASMENKMKEMEGTNNESIAIVLPVKKISR